MSTVYILLAIAMIILGAFLGVFILAVRRGQFDDLDTPAMRMICDGDDEDLNRTPAAPPGTAR